MKINENLRKSTKIDDSSQVESSKGTCGTGFPGPSNHLVVESSSLRSSAAEVAAGNKLETTMLEKE